MKNTNDTTPHPSEGGSPRTIRASRKNTTLALVQFALLTALTMVLHFSGIAIPAFGTKISLVLIPLALCAMLLGPAHGAVLGFIYGATVYISLGVMHMDPFTAFLFDSSPVVTALICTLKTTAAGLLAGLAYRILKQKNEWVAVFVAAAIVPTVNTGLFVLGCICIMGTIDAYIATIPDLSGVSAIYFIMILCAGVNYLLELAANIIFAPALERIIKVVKKLI